jgi:hypothetical protein
LGTATLLCGALWIVHMERTGTGVTALVEAAFVADLETRELGAKKPRRRTHDLARVEGGLSPSRRLKAEK